MRTIILTREKDDGVQCLGDFTFNSTHYKTLERPWKDNKSMISCIPKGTYLVKWTFSPKLLHYTYEVQNVPKRSGIRIHPGNYFFDIEGCILLGKGYKDINRDGKVDVINSSASTKEFESYMAKEPFTLVIR